jgi:hypothetical protein
MSPDGTLEVWIKEIEDNKLLQHKIAVNTKLDVYKVTALTQQQPFESFINCDSKPFTRGDVRV